MEAPILHRMGNEFDHRNLWLQLVLGLVAAGERLEVVLARHAPERDDPAGAPAAALGPAADGDGDDALTAFVLGLVACRDHLHTVLAAAARNLPAPAAAAAPAGEAPTLRSLLR
jgi:hypothetical protein